MGPLLADEATFVFPELVAPLLVVTVAAVVLWLVLLLVAAFATRPRGVDPASATMDLGEESPAVVDLLTNDWRVTPDAVPATLLDLAARGFVDLDQHGQGRTVCRVRRTAAGGLESYERMVLDHVAGLAVEGVVPAEALITGPQDASAKWWRAFQGAVVEDARARGLTRDRWSRPVDRLLRVAALAGGPGQVSEAAAGVGAAARGRVLVGLAVAGAGYGLLRLMLSLRGWTDGLPSGDEAGTWVRLVATVLAVVAVAVSGWGGWTGLRALVERGPGGRSRAGSCGCGPTGVARTSTTTSSRWTTGGPTRSRRGWCRRPPTRASGRG